MTDPTVTAAERSAELAFARTVDQDPGAPDPERPPGTLLGRYVILGKLGAGAMGVVYLAHDLELDRRVAIKLLRAGLADGRLRLRLVREAQAMARLNHPNVVTVHDVGEADGQIFVAMEEVRGVTLRAWLGERPRGWRELLDLFIAVGRGLAAAHAGGIVHRDFKPDNVMVGEEGRPRVMDFGLARTSAEAEVTRPGAAMEGDAPAYSTSSPLTLTLTQAGAIMGTPAYMAPELWSGAPADARSDQYSYCVALWEALYGERPFAAPTLAGLISAVTQGSPKEPKEPGRAPARVRQALLRGLARDPAARWSTLEALLASLERARRGAAGRWGLRIAALTLGVAVIGLGGSMIADAHAAGVKAAECRARVEALHPAWDVWATARALAALPRGASAADLKILMGGINLFQGHLAAAHYERREVCLDPSDPLLAAPWIEPRIDRCFARVAHDLELASRRLESGNPTAIYALPSSADMASCRESAAILHDAREIPEDPATLARWRQVRERLDDLRVAEGTVDRGAAEAAYAATIADAAATGDHDLEREALYTLAEHHFMAGSPRRAHEALARALADGEPPRLPLHGVDDAHLGLHLAEGVIAGTPRIRLAAHLIAGDGPALDDGSLAALLWHGAYARPHAAELTWRDLGLARPEPRRHHWRGAYEARQEARARLLLLAGDPALARSYALKGLEVAADRPTPRASEESSLYLSLGEAELRLGDLDAAEAALQAALARSDRSQVAAARRGRVLLAMAELGLARGDLERAARRHDEAAALGDEAIADDVAYPALVDLVAGRIAARLGDPEEARERLVRARRALIESAGFLRAHLAEVDADLAALALAEGRLDDADEVLAEAQAIRRQLMGEDTIASAPILERRAELAALRGDEAAAAATRAQAAALREAWREREARRDQACRPLATLVHGLDPRDPSARASARPLVDACKAAGVDGFDFRMVETSLRDR